MDKERKEKLKKSLREIVNILNQVRKKLGLLLISIILIYFVVLLYIIYTAKDLFTILRSLLLVLILVVLYYICSKKDFRSKLEQFFSKIKSNIQQTQFYVPLALVVLILIFSPKLDLFLKLGRTFLIIKIVEIAFASLLAVSLSLFLYFDEPIKKLLRKNKTIICTDFLMSFIALWSMLHFQNENWIILSLLFLFILAMNHYLFSEKEIPKRFGKFFLIFRSCFLLSLIFFFISLSIQDIGNTVDSMKLITIIQFAYLIPGILAIILLVISMIMSVLIPFLVLFDFLIKKYKETIVKRDILRNILLIIIIWYSTIFIFAFGYSTSSNFPKGETILLYEDNSPVSPSSIDNLYFSARTITSASVNIIPIGLGKGFAAVESLVGYFLLGSTTAIFASIIWKTINSQKFQNI